MSVAEPQQQQPRVVADMGEETCLVHGRRLVFGRSCKSLLVFVFDPHPFIQYHEFIGVATDVTTLRCGAAVLAPILLNAAPLLVHLDGQLYGAARRGAAH